MYVELRLRTGTAWTDYTVITQFSSLAFDTKYQDIGSISVQIPQSVADSLNIGDDSVVEVAPNSQSFDNMWFAFDSTSGTRTSDDTQWKTLTGKSLVNWLSDCKVYPSSWPTLPVINPDGTTTPIISGHFFQNATPGNILRTLIARGKERGGLSWLDETSFTGTTTTDSVAWSSTLTTTYATGTSLLQVLQDLATRRLISFSMSGTTLKVFNYDSQITHYTPEQVTFRRGANILEQTTNTDSSAGASVVLIQGDSTAIAEVNTLPDGSSPSITRRRELFVAQGGITDGPTLALLAKAQLAISGHIKSEETLGVQDSLEPWISYDVGDWVWEDKSGVLENIQVKQIAATAQDANNLRLALTLGDVLDDLDVQMQQRMDNITGSNASSYGALPNSIHSYVAPNPPVSVVASATAYRDANGNDADQVTVSWSAPTQNVDGTPLTDLDRYELQFKANGSSNWTSGGSIEPSHTAAYISSLTPGVSFDAQVRAVDTDGNSSAWAGLGSPISSLPHVVIIPVKPSTPSVVSAFQGITVTWDGKDYLGGVYGPEFDRCEVYADSSSSFTPSFPLASITARGSTSVDLRGLAYGTTYYVKLVVFDKSGNSSVASSASTATTSAQLSDPDLPNKLVTGAKIADSTIATSNLTVANFGDSVIPNGGFEDDVTITGSELVASRWNLFSKTSSSTITRDLTHQASGLACAAFFVPGAADNAQLITTTPVTTGPNDVWYGTWRMRSSRAITGQSFATVSLRVTKSDASIATYTLATCTSVGTDYSNFEGQAVMPVTIAGVAPIKLQVLINVYTPSDNISTTIYVDEINLRPVGGTASIKDASIISAKINDVSADKITVGQLNADVTVAARIKTADTGARVELSSAGLLAYDSSNNQTVDISAVDGSALFSGTLQVPSTALFASNAYPGQTTINQEGLTQSIRPTINTVPIAYPDSFGGVAATGILKTFGAPGGTFTLRFRSATTSAIAYNASAATIQAALQALSTIGSGNISVTDPGGGLSGGLNVAFTGILANKSLPPLVTSGASLIGTISYVVTGEGYPGIPVSSGVVAALKTSSLLYGKTIKPLYGTSSVQVLHASDPSAVINIPIGTHYGTAAATDLGVAHNGLVGNIVPGATYILSFAMLASDLTGFGPGNISVYINPALFSIKQFAENGSFIGFIKHGIDGFITNITFSLTSEGLAYYPPSVWHTPISSGYIDLQTLENISYTQGGNGSLPSGVANVCDAGWKRFWTVWTAPSSIGEGDVFYLEGPACGLSSAGAITAHSVDAGIMYNAIQNEISGAGALEPTRFTAYSTSASEPSAISLANGAAYRYNLPVAALPTHSDSFLGGRVYVNDITIKTEKVTGGITVGANNNNFPASATAPSGIIKGTNSLWSAGVLTGSFTNYNSGFSTFGFYIDAQGWVHLKGLIYRTGSQAANLLSTIYTMPVGTRPSETHLFCALREDYGTTGGIGNTRVDVDSGGNIIVYSGKAGWSGSNSNWLSLDGISWFCEQ